VITRAAVSSVTFVGLCSACSCIAEPRNKFQAAGSAADNDDAMEIGALARYLRRFVSDS
jgi:hypothetical protein